MPECLTTLGKGSMLEEQKIGPYLSHRDTRIPIHICIRSESGEVRREMKTGSSAYKERG